MGLSVATNAVFTCLHADSTVQVPTAGQAPTQQFIRFLEGNLDDLDQPVSVLRTSLSSSIRWNSSSGEGSKPNFS